MTKKQDPDDGSYRVRAVGQLTGLSPNTIRTWERRYEAVTPARSEGGGRRYTAKEVERLLMLRRLTEAGQAIGELATLSDQALKHRLKGIEAQPDSERLRIAVRSPRLASTLLSSSNFADVVQIGPVYDLNNFEGAALVLELAELGANPAERVRELRRTHDAQVFVFCDFITRGEREALAEAGAWLLHGPPDPQSLRRLIRLVVPRRQPVHARRTGGRRRFNDEALALLMAVDSPIECECPKHLAELVRSLNAFEAYSQRCTNRNPEDAALHQSLAEGTGRARAVMEDLLASVCEAEGLLRGHDAEGISF